MPGWAGSGSRSPPRSSRPFRFRWSRVSASAGDEHSLAAVTKSATARYHDLDVANAAGYDLLPDAAGIICIDNQPVGGMGVHYAKLSLVLNPAIDPLHPEALVYAPNGAGQLKLAALEYVVFKADWDATHSVAPLALRSRLRPDAVPEPLRAPGVLLAPRLGVATELCRAARTLEPAGALLNRTRRAGASGSRPPGGLRYASSRDRHARRSSDRGHADQPLDRRDGGRREVGPERPGVQPRNRTPDRRCRLRVRRGGLPRRSPSPRPPSRRGGRRRSGGAPRSCSACASCSTSIARTSRASSPRSTARSTRTRSARSRAGSRSSSSRAGSRTC